MSHISILLRGREREKKGDGGACTSLGVRTNLIWNYMSLLQKSQIILTGS